MLLFTSLLISTLLNSSNKLVSYVYTNWNQKLKELITLSNFCNFQLFASNTEENISHQKLKLLGAKKVNESYMYIFGKFWVFKREFLGNHQVQTAYWAQNITEIYRWSRYALSVFRDVILLALSDNGEHTSMLMRQKM